MFALLHLAPPLRPHPIYPPDDAIKAGPSSPEVFLVHPYVYRHYLAPSLPDPKALRRVGGEREENRMAFLLPVATWVMGSLVDFERGEPIVIWPRQHDRAEGHPDTVAVIDAAGRAVSARLQWLRQRPPEEIHRLVQETRRQLPKRRRIVTEAARHLFPLKLPEANGIDVPWVYATLYYGGTFLNASLNVLGSLEGRQRGLQAQILREKRALRSAFAFLQRRLSPSISEAVKAEIDWIVASLDRISAPAARAVRVARRRLHAHRRAVRLQRQEFWRDLMAWGVRTLEPRLGERSACQAIAQILSDLFPHLGSFTVKTVRSAYYHRR